MLFGHAQPGQNDAKSLGVAFIALSSVVFFAGCANPGPPKPPSLGLPAIAKDLQAERRGNSVQLHWTTPARTTDDIEIKGGMTAELCREVGTRLVTPSAGATACKPIGRMTVTPGPSEFVDVLPAPLRGGDVVLLTYRAQIFNSTGRSAGDSTGAYAASGTAPPGLAGFQAKASEQGAVLEWPRDLSTANRPTDVIDLKRVDLSQVIAEKKPISAAMQEPRTNKSARNHEPIDESSNGLHLRAAYTSPGSHADTAGTVDTTAVMGETYTYVAERLSSITVAGHALEVRSEPSAAVTVTMRDTFPPKAPTGLAAISGSTGPVANATRAGLADSGADTIAFIDLSWEPNSEADLAGYRVYRQQAGPGGSPLGTVARLTQVPLPTSAYRDVAVKPGEGYIYTVTAVDAAGNESAPSAKALERVPPDTGEATQ